MIIDALRYLKNMSAGSKLKISLPHSKQSPYKGNFWPILVKDLEKLRSNPSANVMETTILKYLNRNLGPRQVSSIRNLVPNMFLILETRFPIGF